MMENQLTVKTPILRLFVRYYSLFGIPAYPVNKITNWSTVQAPTKTKLVLAYLWCTLLNLLVIWSFFFDDPFLQKLHLDHFTKKPFLKLVISANANWNYQIAYACTLPHYLCYLPTIVAHLDSDRYRAVYCRPKLGLYFLLWTLIQLLFFSISYMEILAEYYLLSVPGLIFHWPLMFINYLMFTLPLCITHYSQLGTYQSLKIIAKLAANSTSLEELQEQIRSLSVLTSTLHTLNSFPLAMFLLSNTADSLSALCRLSVRPQLGLCTYFVSMFAYQLYLAQLSTKTVHLLNEIVQSRASMEHQINLDLQPSTGTVDTRLQNAKSLTKNAILKSIQVEKAECSQQYPIQLSQLKILYEDQFRVKLFSMAAMDYAFIVAIALFILKYTVFMLQTKTEN